jgi:peroxin-11B
MASFASQLILHPLVSQTLKVWSTTVGRDKTYRAVQYFSRFIAWYLLSRGNQLEATRWNALKGHLALARKLLRLGKPLEHAQAALRATQASGPAAEQITTIARQIGYFGYLAYDAIVWANTVKFISLKPETAQKVGKIANRFWLAGILFSIAHGSLKGARLTSEGKKLQSSQARGEKNLGSEAEREVKYQALLSARASLRYQFVIDMVDVWLPAAGLGLVNFNEGLLGIFGFISSVMALRTQWISSGKK